MMMTGMAGTEHSLCGEPVMCTASGQLLTAVTLTEPEGTEAGWGVGWGGWPKTT